MKVGDEVYCIPRKEWGTIDAVKKDQFFVSFPNGIGFWFKIFELTY